MTIAEQLWECERVAARPPEKFTVSQWADRFRVLDPINCAQPGPWRTAFAPYMRGILDAFSDPRCSQLVLMGSTQWGKTEGALNMLLWSIDQEPMPTLFVMPTEDDVKSFGSRRLKTAVEYCERVKKRRTQWASDWTSTELAFDGCVLYLGWSNSPSKLASRSIGRLFMDEVDKYPAFTGKEADPISLATERLRWWRDSKAVLSSTPTTTDGYIWSLWCGSDQRWFYVPCPFCGHFQRLTFSRETLTWPADERDPDRIRDHRLASYVCVSCEREIPDDGSHKRRMLAAGVWCPEGGEVTPAGKVKGADLNAQVRGFHVNALYSPVLSWSEVAAKFLESKDDVRKLMNFINSWTGWPWIEKAQEHTPEQLASKATGVPRGEIPEGAVVLTAGVDVQKHEMFWVVLAWFGGIRAHVVDYGRVYTFEQLEHVLTKTYNVRLASVDSGYQTDKVYRFCAHRADRLRAIKGQQSQATPLRTVRVHRDVQGRPGGLLLWHVDTSYFKDQISRAMHLDKDSPSTLTVHEDPAEEFLRQMTSEHKVFERNKNTKALKEVWKPKPGVAANHWWDCAVYAYSAGEMLGVYTLDEDAPKQDPVEHKRTAKKAMDRVERGAKFRGRGRLGGKRGGGWIRKRGDR